MNGKGNKNSQPKPREQSDQNAIKNMRSLFIIKNKSKTIAGIKTLFKQEDVY